MSIRCSLLLASAMGFVFIPNRMEAGRVDTTAEVLIRATGRRADEATQLAVRQGIESGMRQYGEDVVALAHSGGAALPQAAARFGGDIWRLARLSASAPKAVAARPETMLGLSRRFGDDAVRIEIKAPGTAELLAERLSRPQLAAVAAKASPEEIKHLAAITLHCSERQAALAVKLVDRGAGRAIQWLTPGRIASLGFAAALVIAAWQAPESLLGIMSAILTGLLGPAVAIAGWLLVAYLCFHFRHPLVRTGRSLYSALSRGASKRVTSTNDATGSVSGESTHSA